MSTLERTALVEAVAREMAVAIVQSGMTQPGGARYTPDGIAQYAFEIADSLVRESEKRASAAEEEFVSTIKPSVL